MADLIEQLDVMTPMRDGVRLRSDVFHPVGDGPWPTLVMRYPYSTRDGFMSMFGRMAAGNGYAVVVQSCRGRFGSEGVFVPFQHDVADSYDTIEWAAAQPWSNGKVGMYGVSYSGMTQWTAAMARPPHLVCIAPALCAWDWTNGGWYQNDGVMTLGLAVLWNAQMTAHEAEVRGVPGTLPVFDEVARQIDNGALGNLDALGEFMRIQREAAQPLLAQRPLRDIAEFDELASWHRTQCDIDDPRDPYWMQINAAARVADIDLPVLHVVGWNDYFTKGGLHAYTSMRQSAASEHARSSQRMLVGPWNHNGGQSRPDPSFDAGFFFDFSDGSTLMRFFAEHLKGEVPAEPSAPVRIFVMGANVWRDEQEWPLARTQWTPYHLHAGGVLSPSVPVAGVADSYVSDPANPVPGPLAIGPTLDDPVDLDAIAARADVLAYSTAPFAVDTEITGPVHVELWAASSAVSSDYVAKLIEVFADGTSVPLCQGVVRIGGRGVHATPGAIYRHDIDLAAVSVVVKAGHHLRLHIASSEYPTYELNPQTGGRITHSADVATATHHVFHDPQHPSRIVLPIIPISTGA